MSLEEIIETTAAHEEIVIPEDPEVLETEVEDVPATSIINLGFSNQDALGWQLQEDWGRIHESVGLIRARSWLGLIS